MESWYMMEDFDRMVAKYVFRDRRGRTISEICGDELYRRIGIEDENLVYVHSMMISASITLPLIALYLYHRMR